MDACPLSPGFASILVGVFFPHSASVDSVPHVIVGYNICRFDILLIEMVIRHASAATFGS